MRPSLAFALILITSTVPALAAEPATAPAPRRPNILILSIEDTSPWLGCYGDKTAPTPNIDRLAREGVRYVNCFATTPVCAPARHTLITGMYATQTGAMHMRNGQPSRETLEKEPTAYDKIPSYEAVPPPQVRCFTEYLRIAGYYATNNAKEDYQFRAPPTAWDDSSHTAHYRNRKPGQPFFAVFNSNISHESQTFPDAPKRANVVIPANVKIPPYYPDTLAVRETLAQTYNNIVAVDSWVGEKLKELDKLGLRDSTIVIFYSDHGVGLPRGKRACYDSGLRVPLIIRYPDRPTARPRPEVEDRLISFIDFAPTMLSLCGVQPPPYMRGQPFAGEFATRSGADYVFATADRMDAVMDTVRSVSDGRYRYVRNLMPQVPHLPPLTYRDRIPMMKDLKRLKEEGNATPEQWQIVSTHKPAEEFYDAHTDPHETHNLIESPEHKLRIQDMRDALDRWTRETHDLGLIQPESKMVREHLWPPAGKQPFTAAPTPVMSGGVLTITCETDGASIGYRKIPTAADAAAGGGGGGGGAGATDAGAGAGPWKIYTAPVELEPGASYESVAHRIGYRRSPIVQVMVKE